MVSDGPNLGRHQRQLVRRPGATPCRARAVYSGSPVLLLDECTSAFDPKTERKMLDRMRNLGLTVIIVTHRSAAWEVCDRVVSL